ncbi:NPC intracellular cholesterol transporter 2-like [Brevipalpus obovatus]|uniref:NPC intracellular cholesterol transporter 2-like n=1 Tax=Brevipalpus obovatus TaxID=246614 RepID=UPI003D9F3D32
MLTQTITFLCLLGLTIAGQPKIRPCGKLPMPKSIEVSDCDGEGCEFDRSKEYRLTAEFVAPKDSNDLKLDVKGKILGVPLPWANQPTDICNNQVSCPLKSGQTYTYKASFGDLSKYPRVKGIVIYRLNDANGDAMFCFEMKFKLQ